MKTIFSKARATAEPLFDGRPVQVLRHASARTMRLRVDPRDGAVRLTVPRRASLRRAFAWVEEQRGWVEEQLEKLPGGVAIVPDMMLDVGGARLTLRHDATMRIVRREGDMLRVGGDAALFQSRVLRWLKAEAKRVLDAETRAVAERAGVSIAQVSVGDPRSRWGSCSSAGDIRYSWRLILAPRDVLRSTVAHEVAHRVHMNHGPDFKALERQLLGESPAPSRAWLRAHGAALHGYGRS